MTEAGNEPSPPPVQTRGRAAIILLGGTFGLQALTVVTGIVTARLLGVEGRGETALVFALGLMASQLTLGGSLPIAIAKNIAERQVSARDGLRSFARKWAALLFIPSLASGAFMLFLQRAEPGNERYALATAVVVMTLQTIVFQILVRCFQGEIAHSGRLGRTMVVALIPQLLYTVVLSTAWVAGWDWSAINVLTAFFVASFLGTIIGFFALAKPTHLLEHELEENELWTEARRTFVGSVRPIDGIGLDRILIGGLMGTGSLGLYAAAIAVANLCGAVGNAFAVVVLPQVAQKHDERAAQSAVIRRWLSLTAVVVVFVVISLELVVAPAIRIAFGEEFVGAIECARWLVLADGMLGFRKVLIAVLQGQGRGGTASWIELTLAPVMVVAVVLAARDDNLPAIGIAMVVVAALSCAAQGLAVARGGRRRGAAQSSPGAPDPGRFDAR